MSRSKIREELQNGDVSFDLINELIFTRKDTIDRFMSGSANEQFQQIMGSIGLANLQHDIIELQQKVKEYQAKLPELDYRRETLEKELKIALYRKQEYEKKLQLSKEKNELNRVLNWANYLDQQKKVKKLDKEITATQKTISSIKENITTLNRTCTEKKQLQENEQQKHSESETRYKELIDFDAQRKANYQITENEIQRKTSEIKIKKQEAKKQSEHLDNLTKSYEKVQKAKDILPADIWERIEQDLENQLTTVKDSQSKKLTKIKNLTSKLKTIDVKHRTHNSEIAELEKNIEKEGTTKLELGSRLNNEERSALKLRKELDKLAWGNQVTQPIFREIYLKPDNKEWEKAVNSALGGLRSYLLVKDGQTANSLRSYMEKNKFSLWIAPYPDKANKIQRKPPQIPNHLKPIVIGSLEDFLEFDDPRIQNFISSSRNVIFAKDSTSTIDLLELAKITGTHVYTSQPSVFRPDRSFRTNLHTSLSLGSRTDNMDKIEQFQMNLENIESKITQLNTEKLALLEEKSQHQDQNDALQEEINEIQAKIDEHEIKSPQPYLIEINKVETNINSLNQDLKILENDLMSLKDQLGEFFDEKHLEEIEQIVIKMESLNKKILNRVAKIQKIQDELELKQTELNQLKTQLTSLTETNQVEKNRLDQLKKKTEGAKPKSTPEITILENGISRLDVQIASITATARDVNTYNKLKEKFDSTEKDRQKVKEVLDDTQYQLKKYYNQWENKVKTQLQIIQDTTNQLLAPFIKINCFTSNSLDMKQITLEVEYQLYGSTNGYRLYREASGGERALITQALFLSLHTISQPSPLHIIDEFTQRLDERYRGHALVMVEKLINLLKKNSKDTNLRQWNMIPQLIIVAPTVIGSYIPKTINTHYVLKIIKLEQNNDNISKKDKKS